LRINRLALLKCINKNTQLNKEKKKSSSQQNKEEEVANL
jgi:hypothetical protein